MPTEYLNNKTFEEAIIKFQIIKRSKIRYELILEEIKDRQNRKIKRNICLSEDEELLTSYQKTYKEVMKEFETLQKTLADAFYLLATNIVKYARFNGVDQDDAIQEMAMVGFEKLDNFNPKKGKAFNFLTTCGLNSMRQLYRSGRNYNELKKRFLAHIQSKIAKTIIKNGKELSIYKN